MKGSLGRVLVYGGARRSARDSFIEGFVYSNFARRLDTKKSLMDYVFTAYSIIIIWKASMHKVVTLSTIEV